MQSRSSNKWWIITIVALFVLSFLYAFQPLRLKTKTPEVNSTYRFTFTPPLVKDASDFTARQDEINKYLTSKGMESWLDKVEFRETNVLEITTFARDEEQAAADRSKLLGLLKQKYPGAAAMAMPEEERVEPPVAVFGPFALYRPSPKVKLGLDLIGGAHVVLLALPETTLKYQSPEDQPLVKPDVPAAGEAAPGAKFKTEPTLTDNALGDRVRNLLAREGLHVEGTEDLDINFPAPHIMVVKTSAENEQVAGRQNRVITDFLLSTYANIETADGKPGIVAAEPSSVFVTPGTAELVKNIIDRRLLQMSDIREPIMQTQGKDRIIVELPGVKDPKRVQDILKSTALLEFRLIPPRYEPLNEGEDDYSEWRDSQTQQTVPWERVLAETKADFTGRDLKSNAMVSPDHDHPGKWAVDFELRDEQKTAFKQFTGRNVDKRMAIVLDGQAQMAPTIRSEIPGRGQITGSFDTEKAGDLKLLLNAGALPVPLDVVENRTISATLGTLAIQRSLLAGVIGFVLVIVFMVVFYRLPGLLANVALVLYVLIVLAVLVFTKTTLTLPGIAGIILSIGMAVDANILIFERLKEEIWSGKTIRAAIDAGFERAWTAILDSNVNSMIVAAVLYFLGTSAIRSFAVALFVGVVCSLFTAVTVSRWMVTMVGQSQLGQKLHLFGVHETPA